LKIRTTNYNLAFIQLEGQPISDKVRMKLRAFKYFVSLIRFHEVIQS